MTPPPVFVIPTTKFVECALSSVAERSLDEFCIREDENRFECAES